MGDELLIIKDSSSRRKGGHPSAAQRKCLGVFLLHFALSSHTVCLQANNSTNTKQHFVLSSYSKSLFLTQFYYSYNYCYFTTADTATLYMQRFSLKTLLWQCFNRALLDNNWEV